MPDDDLVPASAEASDAVLTVPNLLTFFRIALTPLFLWLALGADRLDLAFGVAVLALGTDIVDGKIARRYGQVSKLGVALDPLSDRLGLAAGAVVLIAHDLAPVWAVIAVVARDALLVLVGVPLLKARGAPIPPVSRVGKMGSFGVSLAFGLFIAAGAVGSAADPSRGTQIAAWLFFWTGTPLSYAAAVGYARAGLTALGTRKTGGLTGSGHG